MDIEQRHAQLGFARLLRARELDLGQGHAELVRDQADCLGEGDVFDLLHEGEDVTGDAASEAVKELAGGVDGERRRLLVMKGTEAGEVLRARLFEFDVVADDPNDVGLLLERVFEVGRGHGAKVYCGMAGKRGGVEGCGGLWKKGELGISYFSAHSESQCFA